MRTTRARTVIEVASTGLLVVLSIALSGASPEKATKEAAGRSCTNVLVVYGEVFGPDCQTHWPDGSVVAVENLDRGYVVEAEIGVMESGMYEAIFLDPPNNEVACAGDELLFTVDEFAVLLFADPILDGGHISEGVAAFDLIVPSVGVDPLQLPSTWTTIKALYAR